MVAGTRVSRGLPQATQVASGGTGVGLYLNFAVRDTEKKLHEMFHVKPNFCFGDVSANSPSLTHGAGFLLWVTNGYLTCLEGYAYAEHWLIQDEEWVLYYVDGNKRDWKQLRHQWQLP